MPSATPTMPILAFCASLTMGCGGSADSTSTADAGQEGDASELDAAPTADASPSLDTACGDTILGAVLCEPFEDSALVGLFRRETQGQVTLSTSTVYRGEGALLASTTSGSSDAEAQVGKDVFGGAASGFLYARAYLYLPSTVEVTEMSILGLAQKNAPYQGASVALGADGALRLDVTAAPTNVFGTYLLPRDQWVCLLLEVEVAQSGSATVRVDGTTRLSATEIDTVPEGGGYDSVTAGILWAPPAQGSAQLFVDELAADVEPIPCD